MNNRVQLGSSPIELTAPSGGVTSGQAVKVGQIFGVVIAAAAVSTKMQVEVEGVFEIVKKTTDVVAEGALLYWDPTPGELTTTASGNLLVGAAVEAAGNTATKVKVRLNGAARADEA